MLANAGEIWTKSWAKFSYASLLMDIPVLTDQQKPYIHQLWADTGCSLGDLPRAMLYRDRWWERERVKGIRDDDDDDDDNDRDYSYETSSVTSINFQIKVLEKVLRKSIFCVIYSFTLKNFI